MAGSAPDQRSPGSPTSVSSWLSMMAVLRAACSAYAASRSSRVSCGGTYQRPSRWSPHGSPTALPSKPHSSQRRST
ncbi:MAG TPA: hypothetical protein VH136_14950 [Trebonia sp.]|nr:hypothetical protein [Trebonia sp.]